MQKKFQEIYENSIKNPEKFWQEASEEIFWFKKPNKILNKSNPPFYKWFEDGVTNTCYNALDIHIDQGRGQKTALIYDILLPLLIYWVINKEVKVITPHKISEAW